MSRAAIAVQEWFSAAELAALELPGVPSTKRGVQMLADREAWDAAVDPTRGALARKRKGRGGGVEYHAALLPEAARTKLAATAVRSAERADRDEVWQRWEQLPQAQRDEAARRLIIVERIEGLQRAGLLKDRAVKETVRSFLLEAKAAGEPVSLSCSTVYDWLERIRGVALHDRAAYLAPDYVGRTARAACSDDAWEAYKALFLDQSKPAHAACYRRVERLAASNGWTLPSAKTLQRRIEAEIPPPVQTLLRYGPEALNHTFPHLQRDRSSIEVMQFLNLDGHTWDVRVQWPEGTIERPHALVVQDIKSGRILAIRHDLTLNSHLVRLALADTFRTYGLPDGIFMDNGRENAAQAISGGQARNRWGRTPQEEPDGLLKALGIKAIAVTPYWGKAKPIERAFRNFAHEIAKAPEFSGAYTGHNTVSKPENYGQKAIPLAEFEAIVRREIAFYNAQLGRRGAGMAGRSFDQVFAEGLQARVTRRLSEAQLRMCLLASKPVTMHPQTGAVTVEGHSYWSPELGNLPRQRVIVRFDPERMEQAASIYTTDNRWLCDAPRTAAGSFDRASDGREHRKDMRTYKRATRDQAAALRRISAREIAAQLQAPAEPPPIETDGTVVALDFKAPSRPDQVGRPAASPPVFTDKWERGVDAVLSRRG
ncbi:MAG: transposase domain-containing protein [Pseudomonadota bacterium]